jgi:hypothetical protein
VPTTVSVFSNTQVSPEEIAWLLNQFDALQGPSGQSWIIDVGPDATDVVGVADGTDGLASMPPELVDAAAEWLGGPPTGAGRVPAGEGRGDRPLRGPGYRRDPATDINIGAHFGVAPPGSAIIRAYRLGLAPARRRGTAKLRNEGDTVDLSG